MPGIDLKQMWTGMRPSLKAIWNFSNAWLERPQDVVQRGLVTSGILTTTSTHSLLGLLWTAFVWTAVLPWMLLFYFPSVLLAIPFILSRHAMRFVARLLIGSTPSVAAPSASLESPEASVITLPTDVLRPPAQAWWQNVWGGFRTFAYLSVLALAGLSARWLWSAAALLGFAMWFALFLGGLNLFGYGVIHSRADSSSANNTVIATCRYHHLTKWETISTTFDTRAARDAYSCPVFKRMGRSKQ